MCRDGTTEDTWDMVIDNTQSGCKLCLRLWFNANRFFWASLLWREISKRSILSHWKLSLNVNKRQKWLEKAMIYQINVYVCSRPVNVQPVARINGMWRSNCRDWKVVLGSFHPYFLSHGNTFENKEITIEVKAAFPFFFLYLLFIFLEI